MVGRRKEFWLLKPYLSIIDKYSPPKSFPTNTTPSFSTLWRRRIHQKLLERVGSKANSIRKEELVLELHPMQTQRVQETLQHIHHEHHTNGRASKKILNQGTWQTNWGWEWKAWPSPRTRWWVLSAQVKDPKDGGRTPFGHHTQDKYSMVSITW